MVQEIISKQTSHSASSFTCHLVTSAFHMPRALYIFEAVFTQCAPDLVPLLHPAPAPYSSPGSSNNQINSPGSSNNQIKSASSQINSMSEGDRLRGELRMLQEALVQRFLPRHIPGVPIAPLPPIRFQLALVSELEHSLHCFLTIIRDDFCCCHDVWLYSCTLSSETGVRNGGARATCRLTATKLAGGHSSRASGQGSL